MRDFDVGQLRALRAAAAEGTLEAAARSLHVTPSAISQRLKSLEINAGAVLFVRSKPIRMTAAGESVLRLARQVELLADELTGELTGSAAGRGRPTVTLAVNADSMATWVLDALAPLAAEFCFELLREDEAHTGDLLRNGTAMAAITSEPVAVPGCVVTALGSMRYRPMAAPAFVRRWFPDGSVAAAWRSAPVLVFDPKDRLQSDFLHARLRGPANPPTHSVPASADFVRAVRLGFGWAMLPDLQTATLEAAGDLIELDPRGAVDVTLHWQQWQLRSASLDQVADAVAAAAAAALRPVRRTDRTERESR